MILDVYTYLNPATPRGEAPSSFNNQGAHTDIRIDS